MTPRVAVIIPAYNVAPWLPDALASVAAQTMPDFECVVVDDASDDNTTSVVNTTDGRFHLMRAVVHSGIAITVRAGVGLTTAPRLMSMGGDDVLDPRYLEFCLDAMDRTGAPCGYGVIREFGLRSDFWNPGTYAPGILATRNCIPGCAIWRREHWDRLGGFDSRFTSGNEDWHMAARAEVAGILSATNLPAFAHEVVYFHRARAHSLTQLMTSGYSAWSAREIASLFDTADSCDSR